MKGLIKWTSVTGIVRNRIEQHILHNLIPLICSQETNWSEKLLILSKEVKMIWEPSSQSDENWILELVAEVVESNLRTRSWNDGKRSLSKWWKAISEFGAEVMESNLNLRAWCQSDRKQSQNLVPKWWKAISELGTRVMESNLRHLGAEVIKNTLRNISAEYLRNLNMDQCSESCCVQ